jgi:hypothetical protein
MLCFQLLLHQRIFLLDVSSVQEDFGKIRITKKDILTNFQELNLAYVVRKGKGLVYSITVVGVRIMFLLIKRWKH